MNEDFEFGYKIRHTLNHGVDALAPKVTERLQVARREALAHQRIAVTKLSLVGIGHLFDDIFLPRARAMVAALALLLGAAGSYYWNLVQQMDEYEELDSALLTDELPPSAYLDRGFHAWLEGSPRSSQ